MLASINEGTDSDVRERVLMRMMEYRRNDILALIDSRTRGIFQEYYLFTCSFLCFSSIPSEIEISTVISMSLNAGENSALSRTVGSFARDFREIKWVPSCRG